MNEYLDYTVTIEHATSVNSTFSDAQFSIYPNPTGGVLFIDDVDSSISKVTIFDLTGKQVKLFESSLTNKIDLSNLANGLYIITVHVGKDVFSRKLIKK
jgi:hypothetical protein